MSKTKTDAIEAHIEEGLATEIGHILWYLQTGMHLDADEDMNLSWQANFADMNTLGISVLRHMHHRGIVIDYGDKSKSHFGKT